MVMAKADEGGLLAHGFFFFFTRVTGPRRSLSLKLSDTRVYAPQILARLGTTTHFCEVVFLESMSLKYAHGRQFWWRRGVAFRMPR